MSPSSILAAAVGAALALAACTPERDTADHARPASSASPHAGLVYGSSGAGGAAMAAGASRRHDDDDDAAHKAASGESEPDVSGESGSHGGFGESGTAGASG